MTVDYLESKWKSIIQDGILNFRILRISPDITSELNIGYNKSGNRCLILELPTINEIDFQGTVKQNLSIEFLKDLNYIVIQLIDRSYYDLFNDLIISLYHRIKELNDVELCSKELIRTFYKWSEFFDDKHNDLLSQDTIKGLFGELLILKGLASEVASSKINDILLSWQGPFDKGHDFILDDKNLEIKTKDLSKLDIRISSEYQLDPEFEKPLELVVISVEFDLVNGLSIKELLMEIKSVIVEKLGDSSILLRALSQKGLSLQNADAYENIKFRPVNETSYRCTDLNFPKLTISNIPPQVNNLKYNLRISSLDEFKISQRNY